MSNTTPIVPKNFGPPPKGIADTDDDTLQDSRPSFAVLAMPSKGQWAFRYQRVDSPYQDDEGNNISNIEVVVIRSRENLSNQYYIKYDNNAKHKAPDCWSSDGKVPDQAVPDATRQNPICEGCPQKKAGSAITASGDPTKACADIRKIAVIPVQHFMSRMFEEYGGPMLYTIKPSSLKNYSEYLARIKAMGHKSFSVVTRMRFDPNVKWQKIMFSPYRALSDEEFEFARELRNDPRTARVLNEEPEVAVAPPDEFDTETGEITPAPTKAPKVVPPTAPVSKVSPKFKVPEKAPEEASTPTPPPPPPAPKVGGFAATSQTLAAAISKPAQRPASIRPMQQATPVEDEQEEEQEEVLDDEGGSDSLSENLDNELKKLLGGDK